MELLQQQQQFNFLLLQICLPIETSHLNPTEEDMEGVSQALARIQFVYRYSHFPTLVHCVLKYWEIIIKLFETGPPGHGSWYNSWEAQLG